MRHNLVEVLYNEAGLNVGCATRAANDRTFE